MATVRSKRTPKSLPAKAEFTPITALDVIWPINETPRFWCPMCGMCADQERLENEVYDVKVAIQKFGGKHPGGKPYIEYFYEDTLPYLIENRTEVLESLLSHVDAVRDYLVHELHNESSPLEGGYIAAPTVEETQPLLVRPKSAKKKPGKTVSNPIPYIPLPEYEEEETYLAPPETFQRLYPPIEEETEPVARVKSAAKKKLLPSQGKKRPSLPPPGKTSQPALNTGSKSQTNKRISASQSVKQLPPGKE